jgi:hypothetical protein
MSEHADSLNLSGRWQGQYIYVGRKKDPVPFSATLNESNSWLNGLIEEMGTAGEVKGQPLAATVQGRRTGRSVTWLKIYHGNFRLYDAVQYAGEVSVDGREIEGRWTIHGNSIGRFLMVRRGSQTVARKRRATVKVPLG